MAHVILIYAYKLAGPEVSADISLGIETAQITEEAMKQAENELLRELRLPLFETSQRVSMGFIQGEQARDSVLLRTMQKGEAPLDTDKAMPAKVGSIRKITYRWTCQYCGQPFETTVYSQRYCNRTHREYAYRERKRTVDALSVNKNDA